ncbi:MAG: YebC/PmpR family DNA-binding transcriptional regulator [Deferribacteraceae bacterium]|jgi:YebC/PmpR family DNA-binding regulatory protein|nr:YebC/PmpR family DNA-binding transcriptional regulator [Deferribacteraceae bacterium]
MCKLRATRCGTSDKGVYNMAGHSKWANIQHRKGAQDAKKGKVFTKIAKELTVAAKLGGGDPSGNSRLRLAMDKARAANMPRDNVDRAIKKGTGEGNDAIYEDITYEAYGPGGVGLLVRVLTDNRNRSITDVRTVITKRGCAMAEAGSVSWQFDMKGIIEAPLSAGEDEVMMIALDAGAEDVAVDEDIITIITAPTDYEKVKKALEDGNIAISFAEVTMKPQNTIKLESADAKKLITIVDLLEDLDDVQEVFGNYEIDDADLEGM